MYVPRSVPPQQNWVDRINPPWAVGDQPFATPEITPDAITPEMIAAGMASNRRHG